MRSISIPCLCALLLVTPAAAAPKSAHQPPEPAAAPRFPFFGLWRWRMLQQQQQPAQLPRAARHSTDTSCLPMQLHAALAGIQARFGPVQVISTHRPGARIRGGQPSLHASCRAVDFKPAPGTYGRVAAYLRSTWTGGLGTYSSGHIHIDVGDNYRWHSGRR